MVEVNSSSPEYVDGGSQESSTGKARRTVQLRVCKNALKANKNSDLLAVGGASTTRNGKIETLCEIYYPLCHGDSMCMVRVCGEEEVFKEAESIEAG